MGSSHEGELSTLYLRIKTDPSLQNKRLSSDSIWNGVWHYDEAGLILIANAISTLLSSLLPTVSILVLYFVKKPLARLAVTMVFTAVFSVTLAMVAKARRIDVFAATTA